MTLNRPPMYAIDRFRSKRSFSSNKSKSKYLKFFALLFLVIFLVFGYFFVLKPFLLIEKIKVEGVLETEAQRVIEQSERFVVGENFYTVDQENLSKILESKIPDYKLLKYERKFPQGNLLFFEKRTPLFYVSSPNGTFLVDNDNFVMSSAGSYLGYDVRIKYDRNLELGTKILDPNFINAVAFVSKDTVVNILNNEVTIDLKNGGIVYLPQKNDELKNYEDVSLLLQKIIQKYRIENREIDTIDLRYSKPLIKYSD